MKRSIKTNRPESYFIALFIAFVLIFSVFRTTIADYAAWLLAVTREISISPSKTTSAKVQGETKQPTKIEPQEQQAPIKISALAQIPPPKNKIAERINPVVNKTQATQDKPATVNLPKTDNPIIYFTSDIPAWNRPGINIFPPLRKFDGKEWNEEKTEIKITTDGKKLYVLCRAYDKNPGDAITGDPKKRKATGLWNNDSIELFLMKNSKSDHYCQYIVSVSGSGQTLYNKITNKPNVGQSVTPPKTFEFPQFNAEEFAGGFEIEARISLSNIDLDRLTTGDTILMQIVRNYRGQSQASVILQLFPVHIYADSRFGASNGDRRAFQAIQIKHDK